MINDSSIYKNNILPGSVRKKKKILNKISSIILNIGKSHFKLKFLKHKAHIYLKRILNKIVLAPSSHFKVRL